MIRSRILVAVALAGLLAACGSSPENRYFMLSVSQPAGGPANNSAYVHVTARLPGVLNRQQMVVRSGPESVQIREFDRWAEPLEDMVSRILAEDVALRDRAGKLANARLAVVFDQFIAGEGGSVRLSGRWMSEPDQEHNFDLSLPGEGGDGPRIARTMSASLGRLADEIAR